ncbi:hypothetical protein TIFTF001_008012 [Ficus carica]|uniref:Uncharacterized protein n=1 Tax=Ficus carica TaxID=3494 RepID=A0AA88D1E7_FICCA|nr:hypothetical protein TIFTF001_008012 [Ficus carica]
MTNEELSFDIYNNRRGPEVRKIDHELAGDVASSIAIPEYSCVFLWQFGNYGGSQRQLQSFKSATSLSSFATVDPDLKIPPPNQHRHRRRRRSRRLMWLEINYCCGTDGGVIQAE